MSANANLVELVRELDRDDLEVAMGILNNPRYSKEEALQQCQNHFSHFAKECPGAVINIEHYIELADTIENFQQDYFAKLMFLRDIYSDDKKIAAKLPQLWALYVGYRSGPPVYDPVSDVIAYVYDPALLAIEYDEKLANDVKNFLLCFSPFQRHVHRKIGRMKGAEACDVTVMFLGNNDSSLSIEDKKKAKETNTPLFIKRPGGWHVYGNVDGVWYERALDNLSAEENKALNREPFNLQQTARIEVNNSRFPIALRSQLRKLHTFSTQIKRNALETFIERVFNDLSIQSEKDELKWIDPNILPQINLLIKRLKEAVENNEFSLVEKLDLIYALYKFHQAELEPLIRAYLYPANQPSIEKLRINLKGERQKNLGAYIRGKIAPEDNAHFTNEFIQQRLIASYLKMCMFYIISQIEKSLKGRFTEEYRKLLQFALFQAAETSNPIDREAFLKSVNLHCTSVEMVKVIESTLEQESASLFEEVNDLFGELKSYCSSGQRKAYNKMGKEKGENIQVLGEKIKFLQEIMVAASITFDPLVQRIRIIENRWAEIQQLSQTEKALQELKHHVNPQSLEKSLPVKSSQKRGVLKFFADSKKADSKKEDKTKKHPHSVPVSSVHDSAATKKPTSLPASVPKQSGEPSKKLPTTPSMSTSSSSSTVVATPPPGLLVTSTAGVTPPPGLLATPTTPNTMLISRHGLKITPPASSNTIRDENPIDMIDMDAKTVSEFGDSDSDTISENLSHKEMRPQ